MDKENKKTKDMEGNDRISGSKRCQQTKTIFFKRICSPVQRPYQVFQMNQELPKLCYRSAGGLEGASFEAVQFRQLRKKDG